MYLSYLRQVLQIAASIQGDAEELGLVQSKKMFDTLVTKSSTEMDADDIKHIRELLKITIKRLRILQLRAAKYGLNCPAEIEMEIDDLKETREDLQQKLNLANS